MLQKTYSEAEIEQFYKDVKNAGIRKPVATLAKLSGLSTGNVSEYLSRKKKASDKLISVFYEHYGNSINVPRETTPREDFMSGETLNSFAEAHRKVVDTNSKLADTNSELALAIVRALPGIQSDQGLAPKIWGLIEEIVSGKKQISVDELTQELKKALERGNGYR